MKKIIIKFTMIIVVHVKESQMKKRVVIALVTLIVGSSQCFAAPPECKEPGAPSGCFEKATLKKDDHPKTRNGITLFDKEDKLPELPSALSDSIYVASPFGFKIKTIGEKQTWITATAEDFIQSEMQRTGKKRVEIETISQKKISTLGDWVCYNSGPRSCAGQCYAAACTLLFNPQNNYYYCGCL